MGGTFLIRINCSKILADNDEAQYVMFIDTSKISIVYELVEWIRWIFSVDKCIYIIHDNSVIHELEDIKILSELKNLKIKPCGQPRCIHKKTYRTLLKHFNLFVSWNEIKVHKYFFDRISQMNQNFIQTNNRGNDYITELSSSIPHQDSLDCNNSKTDHAKDRFTNYKLSENQLSNCSADDSPLNKRRALCTSLEFNSKTNQTLTHTENSSFLKSTKPSSNISSQMEGNVSFSNNFDTSVNENLTLSIENDIVTDPKKNSRRKKSKCKEMISKNSTAFNSSKSPNKLLRPFSLAEILSNLRKDFEKVKSENDISNKPSVSEKEISDEKINNVKIFSMNEENNERKKKQRTRKRKRKSKKEELENKCLISSFLEKSDVISHFNCPKPDTNLKPNHIRFDLNDEDNLMDCESVNDMEAQNKDDNGFIQVKVEHEETFKSASEIPPTVSSNNRKVVSDCQNQFQVFSASLINPENKVEYSSIVDEHNPEGQKLIDIVDEYNPEGQKLINIVEEHNPEGQKLIDIVDEACKNINPSCSTAEKTQIQSFNSNLNTLLSIKEKCKNPIVIERFY